MQVVRRDELSGRLRLRAVETRAGVSRFRVPPLAELPRDLVAACEGRVVVRKSARKFAARALMQHARATWKKRTQELDLIAPDSMVAPRALDFVLPRMALDASHVVVDLGCGDGRWLVAAAERTGCRCIGVEIDSKVAAMARQRVAAAGLEHLITIKEEDLFATDLSTVTHVIMFLSIGGAAGLAKRFREALSPGAVVVSCGFKLPGWTPFQQFAPSDSKWLPVFFYKQQ